MAAIDILKKQWREEARFRPFRPYSHIDDDGLSLGASTLLARMIIDRSGAPTLALDGEEARILATLSLGYHQPIPITALKFIRRASMQWAKGEKALAHFELAYARLRRLETREEAKSLFYADGFLRLGLSPTALMLARKIDTSQLDLLKFTPHFNPYEPRVPAGHHRVSGRWTLEGGADSANNITLVSDQKKEKDGTEVPASERRALGAPQTKEEIQEEGVQLPTPLVEEGDPIGIGPYAGESIPARSPSRNFTVKERQEINRIGREMGCHSCGTKEPGTASGNFIPDHQPPSSLNISNATQRLYPHCVRCSARQGSAISRRPRGEP